MAPSDFDMLLKKEAKTSLQVFRDQSLLRRKFGDDAVKLYNMIDSTRTASQIMEEIGMDEEKFMSIMEFMNNNAMVSVVAPSEGEMPAAASANEEGPAPEEEAPADETSPEGSDSEGEPSSGEKEQVTHTRASANNKVDPDLLSPLEKILFEKYGELGVQIYNLIDGEKTAEEILHQTGVSEAKLVEILEFMDEQGIIKLEKPEGKGEGKEEEEDVEASSGEEAKSSEKEEEDGGKKPSDSPAREPRFKPMTEDGPEEKPFEPPKVVLPPKPEEKKKKVEEEIAEENIIPVDVPEMAKLSMVQQASLFADLNTKFGKNARDLMGMVDGKHDFIDLALSAGISFFDVDAILAYFGKKGFVSFRQLGRDEIKKKYGEDGFAIYKRFGRDGLLLYEMIGKEASLKDIIVRSKLDPDRAIDIFIFIHKVLGLDIPLDRNVIYRQLGLKK